MRNLNSYDKYIRKHRKRHSYTNALRALFEGRDNNPAHEEFFNSLISGLKISACQFMINFMYVMNTVFYIKFGKRSLHVMMRTLHNPGETCDSRMLTVVVPPRYLHLGCVSAELFQQEP